MEEPTWLTQTVLEAAVSLRKFLLRHFFWPRPDFLRVLWFTPEPDPSSGRYHFMQYIGHPWYIKPTLTRRWNLKSWILWLAGGYVPSASHPEYRPEGYRIAELGPVSLEGRGINEMQGAKQRILTKFQGCPFSHIQGTMKAPYNPEHLHGLGSMGDGAADQNYDSETRRLAKKRIHSNQDN